MFPNLHPAGREGRAPDQSWARRQRYKAPTFGQKFFTRIERSF